jgi:hypothetical protein
MNFNELMQRMRELDQPTTEAIVDTPVEECGDMPPSPMGMSSPMGMEHKDTPPPSMSVNLNAQGLDDIAELMKLMTKVNPDMINQPDAGPAPTIEIEPMDKPMGGLPPMGGMGNLDSGPLKMLPDLDADNDEMPGGEIDIPVKGLDQDHDGDHDMDDHDMEKEEEPEEEPEEAFGNSLNSSEPEYAGMDAAVPNGNDLNKPKQSFSGKAYRGDNPMAAGAYESKEQLRASIREELLQRLAEAKGAK